MQHIKQEWLNTLQTRAADLERARLTRDAVDRVIGKGIREGWIDGFRSILAESARRDLAEHIRRYRGREALDVGKAFLDAADEWRRI